MYWWGVGVYTRSILKVKVICNFPVNDLEKLWLSVSTSSKKFAIRVLCKPSSQSVGDFLEQFESCISFITPKFGEMIFMGDLNINSVHNKSNTYDKLNNVFDSYHLAQLVY